MPLVEIRFPGPTTRISLCREASCCRHANMLIVVRCITCGKVLANKCRAYERMCRATAVAGVDTSADAGAEAGLFDPLLGRGAAMDHLGITKLCCRRHMLTHMDLLDTLVRTHAGRGAHTSAKAAASSPVANGPSTPFAELFCTDNSPS